MDMMDFFWFLSCSLSIFTPSRCALSVSKHPYGVLMCEQLSREYFGFEKCVFDFSDLSCTLSIDESVSLKRRRTGVKASNGNNELRRCSEQEQTLTCREPPSILGSFVDVVGDIDSVAIYSCREGYRSCGHDTAISSCQKNGTWSSVRFRCQKYLWKTFPDRNYALPLPICSTIDRFQITIKGKPVIGDNHWFGIYVKNGETVREGGLAFTYDPDQPSNILSVVYLRNGTETPLFVKEIGIEINLSISFQNDKYQALLHGVFRFQVPFTGTIDRFEAEGGMGYTNAK